MAAELLQFPDPPQSRAERTSVALEPFVARVVAQGNRELEKIAGKADALMKESRGAVELLDREIAETEAELRRTEKIFQDTCGERRYLPPIPGWAVLLVMAFIVLGDWALAYDLLDYLGIKGHPDPAKPLAAYFADVGFWEGASLAWSDYSNEKSLLSFSLAVCTFAVGKMTGTWLKQRGSSQTASVPPLSVVIGNLSVIAMAIGFAVLREAAIGRENAGMPSAAWLVFLAVQAFAYAAAVAISAWTADPDPQGSRLSSRVDALRRTRRSLWEKKTALTARNDRLGADASRKAAEEAHRTLGIVAAYRDNNFENRPPSSRPPAFMKNPVDDLFVPLRLDPYAHPAPSPDREEVYDEQGSVGHG